MTDYELLTLFLQPRLRTFKVNVSEGEEEENNISMLTVGARNLQNLDIRPLFINELLRLWPLRRLQSLTCTIQGKHPLTALDQLRTLPGIVFPALKTVELTTWEPLSFNTDIINWLSASAPSLSELTFSCNSFKATPDTLEPFIATLAALSPRLTSCKLRMRRPKDDSTLTPAPVILAPLHALGDALHVLDLADVPLALGADDLLALARACPRLTLLRLGNAASRTTSRVRLSALEAVADACPALTHLGVPLAAVEARLQSPACCHRALRELDTQRQLPHHTAAHEFASRLFPAARLIPEPPHSRYLHIPGISRILNPHRRVLIRDC